MTTSPNRSNPFSTRFVRPAMNEFMFARGHTLPVLLTRFEQQGRWGQIIGPHGSGKSTLLHAISRELTSRGTAVRWYELHEGQRQLPCSAAHMATWQEATVVIVDGYEQLSWLARWRLKRACRQRACGLLITAHANMGLPLLHTTHPTAQLAHAVVARFMQGEAQQISPEVVSAQFEACKGNIREMLFRLYDLYEQR